MRRLTAALAAAAALSLAIAAPAAAPRGPRLGSCPVFPASSPWNRDVSHDAVDPRSSTWIHAISAGGDSSVHPDFGSNPDYGIPYRVVPAATPKVPVTVDPNDGYPDESDLGAAPIPLSTRIEAGGDAHVLVVREGECRLYELYGAHRSGRRWVALQQSRFNLRSNRLRKDSFTSADAAGLPILPGLVRYDEMHAGAIRHAVRFTAWRVRRAWIHPATHYGTTDDASFPPYGARLRLKASYPIGRFHGQAHTLLVALKRYGMILADQGTSWYISGATDRRWPDDDLNQLKRVPGSAFEVVRSGRIHVYRG